MYRYAVVLTHSVLDDTEAYMDTHNELEIDAYYTAMGCLVDVFLHIFTFHKFLDELFWKMALTPNADYEAQTEAEHEIAWRLKKMRRRIQELEDGTAFEKKT